MLRRGVEACLCCSLKCWEFYMAYRDDSEHVARMATDIVVAFLGQRAVDPDQLARLVRDVRVALAEDIELTRPVQSPVVAPWSDTTAADPAPIAETPAPLPSAKPRLRAEAPEAPRIAAVSIDQSITPDYLISLEDGKPYRSLRRHLMAKHGMTPDQYRAKWNLPPDYPMVAPSYAKARSEVAKRSGLGRRAPASVTAMKAGSRNAG